MRICCVILRAQSSVLWESKRDGIQMKMGQLGGRGHMYTYGRNQYNIVKQLFSNFKKLEIYINIFEDLIPLFSKYIISRCLPNKLSTNQYYIRSFQLKHIMKGGEQITNKVKPWVVLYSNWNKRWLWSNRLSFSPIDHYLGLKMRKVIPSLQNK